MIVTDDNEYVIFESSVLLPGGGNDLLNLDKKSSTFCGAALRERC